MKVAAGALAAGVGLVVVADAATSRRRLTGSTKTSSGASEPAPASEQPTRPAGPERHDRVRSVLAAGLLAGIAAAAAPPAPTGNDDRSTP